MNTRGVSSDSDGGPGLARCERSTRLRLPSGRNSTRTKGSSSSTAAKLAPTRHTDETSKLSSRRSNPSNCASSASGSEKSRISSFSVNGLKRTSPTLAVR